MPDARLVALEEIEGLPDGPHSSQSHAFAVDSDLETAGSRQENSRQLLQHVHEAHLALDVDVVCACLGAEAFFTFKYGLELFSDVLLKWIASPISVGLFGGAMIQYLVGSRK